MALDTIAELLTAVERLPSVERRRAQERVAAAVARPAPEARAMLGLLALDLAGTVGTGEGVVVDLSEPVDARRSA